MLDHNSVVPLYEQVAQAIRQDIVQGQYKNRERLPSEGSFSEQYGVSIITIRRAVAELVSEGLVEKKQGKGTFVAAPQYVKSFGTRPLSFTETCAANGLAAGSRVLDASMVPAIEEECQLLQLPEGSEVVHILRLRLADGVPCVLEENFFPPQFAYLLEMDLEGDSIYRYLREEQGVEIMPGRLALKIVRADADTAKLLEVDRKTPLLRMVGVSYQASGEPLHTCFQIGYGENFEFVVR